MAPLAALGIADSSFNAAELTRLGCRIHGGRSPSLVEIGRRAGRQSTSAESARLAATTDPATVLLFVGRLSPNKAQHHLVEALWLYRRWYDPEARLHLVGPAVTRVLRRRGVRLRRRAGPGRRGPTRRGSHRRPSWPPGTPTPTCSSASPSHEGFCIPLLEAMRPSLPIVAFAAGAVPETLGGAGILLDSKRPERGGIAPSTGCGAMPGWPTAWLRPGTGASRRSPRPVPAPRFVDVLHRAGRVAVTAAVKLAFVTPRYGLEVIGGAETAARMLAERLCVRPGWEVEVLTSCALDHLTWENTEPPGTSVLNGVTVHRFPTGQPPAARLLHPRRQAPGVADDGHPGRVAAMGGPQRSDVPGPGRRGGRHRRRRGGLLSVPVRHHGGQPSPCPRCPPCSIPPPTTSRPSISRPSARASGTSTGWCTTPGRSGT